MQQQSIHNTKIKEIFSSIQGEGPYVGEKHLFIRFCKCNLNCRYCDTDFLPNNAKSYSIDELNNIIQSSDCKIISLTGAEPLLEVDFLKQINTNKKIYLETNGTLYQELSQIIDKIDIVSMDIKLKSATGQENRFLDNEKFLNIASLKEVFIKVVFDNAITDDEIDNVIKLAKKHNTLIVLQPKMPLDKNLKLNDIFNRFYSNYQNIRLIPQTHKFLGVE